MAINKDQIKELLGNGLTPAVVASAVGCEASYISQLLSEESFANEVAAKRTVALAADSKRDATIDGIEDSLLSQLASVVSDGAFFRPRDLLSAVAVVNKLQRRGKPINGSAVGSGVVNNIVNISLPTHVSKKFVTNRANEVIEVEGQTLVTMPAHQLLRELAAKGDGVDRSGAEKYKGSTRPQHVGVEIEGASSEERENVREKYQKALNYLPSGLSTKVISDA